MTSSPRAAAARILDRWGTALAAAVAAVVGLPGLALPFLSDDWVNLAAVEDGVPVGTPFQYFRPLYLATFALERRLWGLSPFAAHLVNLMLAATAAALLVVLVRRYTGRPVLAGAAGLLFALHPFHVENTAWVAGRADSLSAVLVLVAALAYDRWRVRAAGFPVLSLLALEAALLVKESAVVLAPFLIVLGLLDRTRRAGPKEWLRGYLPHVAVALAHFALLRPAGLTGPSLRLGSALQPVGLKRLGNYFTAVLTPVQSEIMEAHPRAWFAVAAVAGLVVLALAIRASGRVPGIALVAAAVFLVLLGPNLMVGFQERYFFLPSGASAVVLVALLGALRFPAAALLGTVLSVGWIVSLGDQWIGWREAGAASESLVAGLVEASRVPQVREILVANAPHRVRGAPVCGNWSAAVRLSGGRSVKVVPVPYVDYATRNARILLGPDDRAIRPPPPDAEVDALVPARRYSRYVYPRLSAAGRVALEGADISLEPTGALHVRIEPAADGGRVALLWTEGRLRRLF